MNSGAFGENFPYSNFHDLNMDWIIKIAKDFLDQYTHIQETIANGEASLQNLTEEGLAQLQEKADNLEELLQEWYETHSNDIATQLTNALAELQQTLTTNIATFDTHADQKTAQSMASIPGSYGAMASAVTDLSQLMLDSNLFTGSNYFEGIVSDQNGETFGTRVTANAGYGYTHLIPITNTDVLWAVIRMSAPNQTLYAHYYDANNVHIGQVSNYSIVDSDIPSGTASVSIVFQKAYMDSFVVKKNEAPYYNAKANEFKDFIRLDQGRVASYMPSNTSPSKIFPYNYLATIMSTYPIIIPENRSVYFYSNNKYFTHNYYDFNGNLISSQSLDYGSGLLTIPANAKYIVGYSAIATTESDYCYLALDHEPAYHPSFGEEFPDTPIKGKNIVMIGDSIMHAYYFGGGWCTILKDVYRANLVTNMGHDGWEVSRNPNIENNCLIDLLSTITPTGYDMIILSGGINDCSRLVPIGTLPPYTFYQNDNEFDFAPAVFNYLQITKNRFIDQKIMYLLTPYKEWNNNNISATQRTAWNVIRNACEEFGIEVIDLAKNGGLVGVQVNGFTDERTQKYYLNADGTHPNFEGYKYLTAYIASKISEQFMK